MNHFYVYVLFRETGEPFYIGKGSNGRWLVHEWMARRGEKGHRAAIIREMQTRGIEVPKVKLHQDLTEEVAHAYEVALIAAIGRRPHGSLTNLTDGGDGASGHVKSPEARAKVAAAHKGKIVSTETKARMSKARKGTIMSPGARAKMSAVRKGRAKTPEHQAKITAALTGLQRSQETKAKISAAHKGRVHSPETRAKVAAASMGRVHSPETKEKMAAAAKLREARHRAEEAAAGVSRYSPETKAKISAAGMGRIPSSETRAKIAAAHKGRIFSPSHRAKISAAKLHAVRGTSGHQSHQLRIMTDDSYTFRGAP